MAAPSVSIVVVSHGRPKSLLWSLSALAGLHYDPFEIVVVADLAAAAYVQESHFSGLVKLIAFETPNISAARNAGIKAASGEIIAFVDDDAAAEPMWLDHLVGPFENEAVAAAGGYVRGRNGISYQWTAREVDRAGRAFRLDHEGTAAFVPHASEGRAIKTEGTNMAVRRSVLEALGGFDEAYHFYLDETDLNLRLTQAGWKTALVPRAEVHHAYRASTRRGADRAVKDLFDVGASTALMLRKFGQDDEPRLSEVAAEQAGRLSSQRDKGLLSERDAARVYDTLKAGFEAGKHRSFGQYPETLRAEESFMPFVPQRSGSLVLSGRRWQRWQLRKRAEKAAAAGVNVSLFMFDLTPRRHQVRFDEAGYWEQSGGQFGASDRSGAFFRTTSFSQRLLDEETRVAPARGLPLRHAKESH